MSFALKRKNDSNCVILSKINQIVMRREPKTLKLKQIIVPM